MRAEKAIDVQGKYIAQLEAKMKNSGGENTTSTTSSEATETGQGGGDEPQGAATTRQRRVPLQQKIWRLKTKLMT